MDFTAQAMNYIAFLKSEYGLNVTIHARDKRLMSLIRRFPQVNIHSASSCVTIKSVPEMWDVCIAHQDKIYVRIAELGGEPFFGTCYAGIGEFIFPLCEGNNIRGFLSVGQFRGSDGKMLHAAAKYHLGGEKLKKLYDESLIAAPPDPERLKTLVAPLCATLLFELENIPEFSAEDTAVKEALSYLHRHFCSTLRLADVAAHCNCAVRTLTAAFRRSLGVSIGTYVENLRMEKARKLLAETEFSVTEIAYFCGYNNSNYFTHQYTRHFGTPPTGERGTKERENVGGLFEKSPPNPAKTFE